MAVWGYSAWSFVPWSAFGSASSTPFPAVNLFGVLTDNSVLTGIIKDL